MDRDPDLVDKIFFFKFKFNVYVLNGLLDRFTRRSSKPAVEKTGLADTVDFSDEL